VTDNPKLKYQASVAVCTHKLRIDITKIFQEMAPQFWNVWQQLRHFVLQMFQ